MIATKKNRQARRGQGDFFTDSRFIYYGQKTRNEYRITRFGISDYAWSEDNLQGQVAADS